MTNMIVNFDLAVAFSAGAFLVCVLVLLSWIDLKTGLLPDAITIPLIWAGLLVNLGGVFAPINDAVLGAVFGYALMWGSNFVYRFRSGVDGIGQGDYKFMAALGAWFGVSMVPMILLAACCFAGGGVVARGQALASTQPIPFGPSLAVAGFVALIVVFSS